LHPATIIISPCSKREMGYRSTWPDGVWPEQGLFLAMLGRCKDRPGTPPPVKLAARISRVEGEWGWLASTGEVWEQWSWGLFYFILEMVTL